MRTRRQLVVDARLDPQQVLGSARLRCPVCASSCTRERGLNGLVVARCVSPECVWYQEARGPASPAPVARVIDPITVEPDPEPAVYDPPIRPTLCAVPSCGAYVIEPSPVCLCPRHLAVWREVAGVDQAPTTDVLAVMDDCSLALIDLLAAGGAE